MLARVRRQSFTRRPMSKRRRLVGCSVVIVAAAAVFCPRKEGRKRNLADVSLLRFLLNMQRPLLDLFQEGRLRIVVVLDTCGT